MNSNTADKHFLYCALFVFIYANIVLSSLYSATVASEPA